MRAIGVNQSPGGGSDYPFTAPTPDVSGLVGDLYLSFEDDVCQFIHPFRISFMWGFGTLAELDLLATESDIIITTEDDRPLLIGGDCGTGVDGAVADMEGLATEDFAWLSSEDGEPFLVANTLPLPRHKQDLVIVDGNGAVVFDSTTATEYQASHWGEGLDVVEWRNSTSVCRVTRRTDVEDLFELCIVPDNGRIDARTYERLPARVKSLTVGVETFSGPVVFSAGYNLQLAGSVEAAVDGGRFTGVVEMDAVPGAGLGRFPGCEEGDGPVRTINRVPPGLSGNFRLALDDCGKQGIVLSVDDSGPIRLASRVEDGILLSDDCHPCRECDYYVRTYRGLKRMWDRWKAVALKLETARDLYEQNRQRWMEAYQCNLDNAVRVVAQPNKNCKIFVGGSFCNTSKCCLAPVVFRFMLTKYENGVETAWDAAPTVSSATVIGGNGKQEKIVPAINGGVVTFTTDFVQAQRSTLIRFRVCSPCADEDSLKVHLAVFTQEPAVNDSGQTCEHVSGALASEVQETWDAAGADELDSSLTLRGTAAAAAPFDPNSPTPAGC